MVEINQSTPWILKTGCITVALELPFNSTCRFNPCDYSTHLTQIRLGRFSFFTASTASFPYRVAAYVSTMQKSPGISHSCDHKWERPWRRKKCVLYLISESGNVVVSKRSSVPFCGRRRGPDASHRLSSFLFLFEARFTITFISSVMLRLTYAHLHRSKKSGILPRF